MVSARKGHAPGGREAENASEDAQIHIYSHVHTHPSVLTAIKRIEKKTFPTSEALDFEGELGKRSTRLIYTTALDCSLKPTHDPSWTPTHDPSLIQTYDPSSTPTRGTSRSTRTHDSSSTPTTRSLLTTRSTPTDAGLVTGYCVYTHLSHSITIHKLCVPPSHRRRGYGQRMIQYVLDQAQREVYLWVDEGRVPARQLYAQMGFAECQRVEGYYGPRRVGIRMTRG